VRRRLGEQSRRAPATLTTPESGTHRNLMDFLTDQITVTMCSVMMRDRPPAIARRTPARSAAYRRRRRWAPLLLLGKSGFVNEAARRSRITTCPRRHGLGAEQILIDGRKVVDLIAVPRPSMSPTRNGARRSRSRLSAALLAVG